VSRILIVEDEAPVASLMERGLQEHGFTTAVVTAGREGLSLAASADFDLLVLDLDLPDMDGVEVVRRVREHDRRLPIIVVSPPGEPSAPGAVLEGEADDFVRKPFPFDDLLARVRIRLRDDLGPEETVLRASGATLDLLTRRASVGDRTVDLTAREFALAETFFRHPGQVLSRQQLLSRVWGHDYDPRSNLVDVYVGQLRKKLGEDLFTTVRGMGYRLEDQGPSNRRDDPGE
jgi:two-component system, OmpR family, copper resistance phosphate regulon response regulator CusR